LITKQDPSRVAGAAHLARDCVDHWLARGYAAGSLSDLHSGTRPAVDMTFLLAMIGTPTQMIILLVVILLLFGSRLPALMRSLGSSMNEFKKGIKEGSEDDQGTTNKT
jgi:sec-independent protein translocase protein TatA